MSLLISRSIRPAAALALLATLTACGHSSSPSAPSPPSTAPATTHANVSITSLSVTGEAREGGFAYRVVVHLRESAGVAATVPAVDLIFMNGATQVAAAHFDQPIGNGAVCPANGTADTRDLTAVDTNASHPYATQVQATVTFTDGSSAAPSTVTASADVPPLPPPATFAVTGVITDKDTREPIGGARLEVLNGINAGKSATADRTGTYVLRDLTADSFRLRASADDYDWGEQNISVPANPRADFELRKHVAPCHVDVSPTSLSVSGGGLVYPSGIHIVTAAHCRWTASTTRMYLSLGDGYARSQSGVGSAYLYVGFGISLCPWKDPNAITIRWDGGEVSVAAEQFHAVQCNVQ